VKEAYICEAGPNQTLKYVGALRSGYSSLVGANGSLVLQRAGVCCRRLDRFGRSQVDVFDLPSRRP
jgi:hypothetical protein